MSRLLFPKSGPKVSPDFLRPAAQQLGWTLGQLGVALGYKSKSAINTLLTVNRPVSIKIKEAVDALLADNSRKSGLPVMVKTKQTKQRPPKSLPITAPSRNTVFVITVPNEQAVIIRMLLAGANIHAEVFNPEQIERSN